MNVTALEKRLYQRLEQDPGAPVTPEPELLHALNAGYQTLALLTLCLEKTITITLAANKCFYGIRNLAPDYLRPLRLTSGDPIARLRPARLADLDLLDAHWQDTSAEANPDPPGRYMTLGLNLFAVWRQPRVDTPADFTYAYTPAALVAGGDTPLVPEEYHESLVKFGLVWIRLKEGGQEFLKVFPLLAEFMVDATKLGDYVRARSIAAGYDSIPFELKRFDTSRLLKELSAKPATR